MSTTDEIDFGIIANFAKTIGATEDALRLLISLLAGKYVLKLSKDISVAEALKIVLQ